MAKRSSRKRANIPLAVATLREALARKGTQAIVAKETGVSTKTLSPLLEGRLPDSRDSEGRLVTKITPQRIRGVVPAIVRLLHHADVPTLHLADLLAAYGIPDDDYSSWQVVQRAERAAGRPAGIDDVVTRAIYERETQDIRLGAIAWPPFLGTDDIDGSPAFRFLVSLFGSIYPMHHFVPKPFRSLRKANDALVTLPMKADVVFGVYQLPARAAAGLRFIPLPGITVALGALKPQGYKCSWSDIQGLTGHDRPFFVVSEEEAGEIFLQGVCRRTLATPQSAETMYREPHADAEELAMRLVSLRVQRPSQPIGLLIESMTCKEVLRVLNTDREKILQRLQAKHPALRADSPQFDFEPVESHPDLTPRYPLGIAIRGDAERLQELISLALDIEVFGTGVGRTAMWYLDLFQQVYPDPPDSPTAWRQRDGIHLDLDLFKSDPKLKRLKAAMEALAAEQPRLKNWIPPIED